MIVSTEGKLLKTVFGSPETIELLTHTACMEVIDANDLDIEDLRTLESPPEVLEQLREMLWKNVDPSLEPDT